MERQNFIDRWVDNKSYQYFPNILDDPEKVDFRRVCEAVLKRVKRYEGGAMPLSSFFYFFVPSVARLQAGRQFARKASSGSAQAARLAGSAEASSVISIMVTAAAK